MARPLAAFLRDPLKVGFVAVLVGAVIVLEVVMLMRPKGGASLEILRPEASPGAPAKPEPAPRKVEPFKPLPPAIPEPAKPEAQKPAAPEPAQAQPPRGEPPKAEPAKPEPKAAEPAKPARRDERPAKTAPSRPAPAEPAPVPESRPAPAPEPPAEKARPAPATTATPVSRAPLEFPGAAAAKGIDSGSVKARLTIDAEGRVTNVQILEARPRRYFDEEASRSLRQWRFNPGADNRTYDVEIGFQR